MGVKKKEDVEKKDKEIIKYFYLYGKKYVNPKYRHS